MANALHLPVQAFSSKFHEKPSYRSRLTFFILITTTHLGDKFKEKTNIKCLSGTRTASVYTGTDCTSLWNCTVETYTVLVDVLMKVTERAVRNVAPKP